MAFGAAGPNLVATMQDQAVSGNRALADSAFFGQRWGTDEGAASPNIIMCSEPVSIAIGLLTPVCIFGGAGGHGPTHLTDGLFSTRSAPAADNEKPLRAAGCGGILLEDARFQAISRTKGRKRSACSWKTGAMSGSSPSTPQHGDIVIAGWGKLAKVSSASAPRPRTQQVGGLRCSAL